ncbi:MAG: class I SAM-dependent methyltransferase [Bacteroidota bacterium]
MEEIKPIAMPGIHSRFLPYFEQKEAGRKAKVLDVGAGHGAFAKTLHDKGYEVAACDLYPAYFHFKEIECTKADITDGLPYPDASFDAVIAIEVMEHISNHETFFKEAFRVLKPGGMLYISTPNILSLKSRFRFFFSGFFYTFEPLDRQNYDGLQHTSALSIDQFNYWGIKSGFETASYGIDKKQKSSRWLLIYRPFLWLFTRIKKIAPIHNEMDLLLGRVLFLNFPKQ